MSNRESPEATVPRLGRDIKADEVFWARSSGDLPRMMRAMEIKTNPIDRHYLLAAITEITYKLRSDKRMALLCESVTETHVKEYPKLARSLKAQSDGITPRARCFDRLATVLAEMGDLAGAIKVTVKAVKYEQALEEKRERWVKRLTKMAEKFQADNPEVR
jgi:hypothetical protein